MIDKNLHAVLIWNIICVCKSCEVQTNFIMVKQMYCNYETGVYGVFERLKDI